MLRWSIFRVGSHLVPASYLVSPNQSKHGLQQCLGQLHFWPILSEDGLLHRKAHGKHIVSQMYSKDTTSTITATFTNLSHQVRSLQHEYSNTNLPQLQLEMQWPTPSMGYSQSQGRTLVSRKKVEKAIQYTKIVLMLGDEGLSRWIKFKLPEADQKNPTKVFKAFWDSLGKDVSFHTARVALYNNYHQQKGETTTELDIRLSRLIDECQFPTEDIVTFIKQDIFINANNYCEVKKWAAHITYTKIMDNCNEYKAAVCDYVTMASDNSHLQTAFQQGTASVDNNYFKGNKSRGGGKRSSSHSNSRERSKPHAKPKSKCKRCGFEKHITTDGS